MNARFLSTTCTKSLLTLTRIFKVQGNNAISFRPAKTNLHQDARLKNILEKASTQCSNNLTVCVAQKKNLHTKVPKTPDLIYIPHILRWLKTKFRFKVLQKKWDPEFTEGSFIYGTSRAICRVTEIIHENKPEQLKGLLTTSAFIKVKNDISTRLSKIQKALIKIEPDDIKILVPMSVIMNKDGDYKICRVAMRVLALKWVLNNGVLRLVLVALQTEFLRDYTPGVVSDWTISAFDVLECAVLAKPP